MNQLKGRADNKKDQKQNKVALFLRSNFDSNYSNDFKNVQLFTVYIMFKCVWWFHCLVFTSSSSGSLLTFLFIFQFYTFLSFLICDLNFTMPKTCCSRGFSLSKSFFFEEITFQTSSCFSQLFEALNLKLCRITNHFKIPHFNQRVYTRMTLAPVTHLFY